MVVFSTNDAKDFMVFTDSPIDGLQITPCWQVIASNILYVEGVQIM